ncbi:hypothetical protein H310_14556 [Aphanomyces invadans]|uniref:CS domain-containing protein n=1 Tax=Aphanomyces invadans TaxID=157072 RepID=A0A024T9N9_9STRA|nr:hypothetical protein H310_14556 [Aphanomyces invadans]ETV90719.1 hypothetical protein H310_14556 [Aphanomyces invadans]|eukprot:XP_008880659.1 hypothetical protein H310_14556 [Aphanomyces invadans]
MARRASSILDNAAATFLPTDDTAAAILSRFVDPSGRYGWTQTLEELYVYVPVRPRIVRKGVNVLATQSSDHTHWFTVIVDTIPRVHAQLAAHVKCASLDWDIAAQKESSPFYSRAVLPTATEPSMEVCITLAKAVPGHWATLFGSCS